MKASLIASAVASAFAASIAMAQQAPAEDKKPAEAPKKLEQITVTSSPLGRAETELAQPATVLNQDDLRRKRAASIGDTLANETGVQSSAFGPGSGRPIIRGLDGPRIRVLENGVGTLDASTVSPDHMVTTESLHAEQIEILRGPASLLYGSGAIGGVVNVISNLIPRRPADGLSGTVEARAGTANRERTLGAELNGGAGAVAWHLDGFKRKTSDYRIPDDARNRVNQVLAEPVEGERLPDSAVDAKGGGAGVSWVGSRGYLGVGGQTLENTYGIPSGEGSHIHLRQKRYEVASEALDPLPGFTRMRMRLAHTDYQHEEIEAGGDVATTFKNKATESRFELAHKPWAGITGTFGVQLEDQELSALGAEAIIPKTRSRNTGVFLVEQKEMGDWIADAGLRVERSTRLPSVSEADAEKFSTAVDRRFTLVTPAVGLVWKFKPGYNLSVSATQAQRAPTTEELFSNGAHGATATFDIGNPQLQKEVSRNVDVTLRKTDGDSRWKVNVYANRIKDYVFAASVDSDGDGIPDHFNGEGVLEDGAEFLVQQFSQAEARFRGVEAEWSWRPGDRASGVRFFGDYTRGKLSTGENLPRISPARLGAQVDGRKGPWSASLSAIHALAQKKTAPLETPTPAYTRVDAEVAWQLSSKKGSTVTLFLQGSNLLDEDIRLHTSYLKEVAPQMGRSFTLGVRAEF